MPHPAADVPGTVTAMSTSFPLQEHLGFSVEGADGHATAALDLDDRHLNPNAVSHGAVPFTMMDTAMGAAVMSTLDDGAFCATIEIHTRFHRAAASGRLTAEATIIQAGRRIVQLEAKTVDEQGRLVATATGSFAILRPEPVD